MFPPETVNLNEVQVLEVCMDSSSALREEEETTIQTAPVEEPAGINIHL